MYTAFMSTSFRSIAVMRHVRWSAAVGDRHARLFNPLAELAAGGGSATIGRGVADFLGAGVAPGETSPAACACVSLGVIEAPTFVAGERCLNERTVSTPMIAAAATAVPSAR